MDKINNKTKSKKQNEIPLSDCLKMLLKYIKPYKWYLILALIFTVGSVASTLYAPVVIGNAIDYMIGADSVNFEEIVRCILILIAITFTVMICQWLSSVCTNKISFNTIRDLRYDAFTKLNKVPLKYIDSNSHGDIMSRIVTDADLVSDGLIQGFTQVFSGVITILGTIAFMFSINVRIALIVFFITPLSLAVSWFIAKRSHNTFKMQSKKRGEMSGLVNEMIGSQKVVKAFSYETEAEKKFDVINAELKKYGTLSMFFSSISNPFSRFINGIAYAAVIVFGAITVINNPVVFTIGMLSSFLFYANQYSKPFNEITSVISELQSSFASLRRIREVLTEKEESDDSHLPELIVNEGTLKAENVEFSYSSDKPLITDFNIDVKKAQKIAIVGPTGCGKTTVINLLMRFYDVNSGRIIIDGTNIRDVTRSSLRSNFGMVLQETWLFEGTIKDNIAYGKEDATMEEIIAAADAARIHKFIMRQDNGYDTVISGDGTNISQGQKQLLCIARIMLKNPPMLILDEATSSIDTRTEKRIQKAFTKMMQGKTSFIIAHRLSTIMDADLILAMNNGDIVESGTHKELLEKGGFYAYLYNSQFATY